MRLYVTPAAEEFNDESLRIGAEVLAARPPQIPWKVLCQRYGLSRSTLVRFRRWAAASGAGFPRV
jgi:hypothetical protein